MQISISNAIGGGGGTQGGGTPTPPPFSNVDSFSFDGVDEYFIVPDTSGLSFGNGTTDSPFSISTWVKIGQTTAQGIVTKYGSSSSTREYLFYTTGGKLRLLFIDANNGANNFATGTTSLSTNTWYHVACTYDGRGGSTAYNGITLYINGVAESVTTSGGSYTAMSNTSQNVEIGKYSTNELLGNIDETAIFTTELSSSDVSAIYNNGEPQSLDTYSPFVWFRMGDNATWNGATWTMTSVGTDTRIARSIFMVEANRTTDVPTAPSFTNTKSILLDGVDDYVDIANPTSFSDIGDFSVSAWLKFTSSASTKNALNIRDNRYLYISGGKILGAYKNATNQFRSISTPLTYNDGNYHHVLFVKNSTNMILFVDGTQVAINSNGGATFNGGSTYARIGARASAATASNFFPGNIDELAFFNSDQSVNISTIYNNGVPNDLANLSPFSWWRCGDNDTAPTLTDNGSAGNNGTMTNFSTFSTDVPIPFTNTKSILLDGIDDKVTFSDITASGAFTISFWIKPTVFNNSGGSFPFGTETGNANFFKLQSASSAQINIGSSFATYSNGGSGNDFVLNQWQNVALVRDASNAVLVYLNGVAWSTGATASSTLTINSIGRVINSSFGYSGHIDEWAFWNSDQSANLSAIYGSGVPTSLASYSPLHWYRCGDGDVSPILTDNGSGGNNGTMTNFSTFSTDVPTAPSFSNTKSILLDGVDDEVSMDFTNTSTTGSISVWIKPTDYTTGAQIVWLYVGSGYRDLIALTQRNDGKLNLSAVDGGSTRWRVETDNVVVSNGAWTHVVFSFDGSNGTIYINGSIVPQTYTITTNKSWWWDDLIPTKQRLGILRVNGYSAQQRYNGNIEEQSVFSSALSSTEVSAIYNNGLPTDLSSESNILAWYRMGDGDTAPTLTDNIGSNNGTMTNFTTFSTDVPT